MQARAKANTLPLRLPRSSGASHLPCPRVVAVSFRCCRSEADESGSEALVWAWSAPAAVADGLREIFSDLRDRKSTRLNSSHLGISYAVFCLKKKKKKRKTTHDKLY